MARTGSLVATLVTAAVLAGGCGGDDSDEDPIADAAETTIERGGVVAVGEIVAREGRNRRGVIHASGREDVRSGTADYELVTKGLAKTLGGPNPSEVDARVVKRRSVVYGTDPFIVGLLRDERRRWMRITLGDTFTRRIGLEKFGYLLIQSPAHALRYARAARTEERVGRDRLGTHYRGAVNMDKVKEAATDHERRILELDAEPMEHDPDGLIDIDAWIDDDGLVRKVLLSYDTKAGNLERRMEITDVGVPVRARPPDPSQFSAPEEGFREVWGDVQ